MSRHPERPPDDIERGEGFISRWSKRKEESRPREISPAEETSAEEINDLTINDQNAPDPEPVKCDEDMPAIESIDEDSDVSGFFSPGVSEALRKAALRKFFHSPAFNIVDGLDDYDDDFTKFEALGDIITADMRHQEELEKERQREKVEQEVEQVEAEHGEVEADSPESEQDARNPEYGEDENETEPLAQTDGQPPHGDHEENDDEHNRNV